MIKRMKGNILDTGARLIINPIDNAGIGVLKFNDFIAEEFPHVMKEAMKQYGTMKKMNAPMNSMMQYVPADVWALSMTGNVVDVLHSENPIQLLDYDEDWKYIINWFVLGVSKKPMIQDRDQLIVSIQRIGNIAYNLGEPWRTLAIPAEFLIYDQEKILEQIFTDAPVTLEIWS